SCFGEVLEFIRTNSNIPGVLLTNGTMLHLPEVRAAASQASVVKVSLSAWDQSSYGWLNRPHSHLRFDQLVEGQKAFRAQFQGQLWMEVFLIAGVNSMPAEVRKIAGLAKEIGPDRIQLNTTVRPPAEDFATAMSGERMAALAHLFEPAAEVIGEFSTSRSTDLQVNQDTVFSMLQRRPCTAEEIAELFGMHINEVSKYLGKLMRMGQISAKRNNNAVYYCAL
ncbi:MAG: hypothetical protein JRJ85_24035, partial [Deltaproteobacteria bacterium]|nr:hypothetical protein [Deltaproteobacteria bacterium]